MEEIARLYKKEFAHTRIRNELKFDIDDVKKRLLHIFSLEIKGACAWAQEIGVSYRTLKYFFMTDKHFTDTTLRKFVDCLTRYEKKHKIFKK